MLKNVNYHKNSNVQDDKLFVDFNLIKFCEDFDSSAALNTIDDYMKYNLELYRRGQKKEVAQNFSNFIEKDYFPTLGFSKGNKGGRGVTSKKFIEILDLVFQRECAELLIEGNIFAPIFVENYNMDRNTDFLLTLMLPQLSDYTKMVAKSLGLETKIQIVKVWDTCNHAWMNQEITLAKYPEDIIFRIIVPEDILVDDLPYSGTKFIYRYWIKIENAKREEKGLDKYTVSEYSEYIKNNYGSNQAYLKYILSEMDDDRLWDYLTRFARTAQSNRDRNK